MLNLLKKYYKGLYGDFIDRYLGHKNSTKKCLITTDNNTSSTTAELKLARNGQKCYENIMNNTQKKTIAKTSIQTLAYNISVTQQFSLGRTILTVFSASENDP